MTEQNKKILISSQVKKMLTFDPNSSEQDGFCVRIGENCADMLNIARTQEPDIIFTSPACTTEDRTCCRLLREDSRICHIPIVAIVDSSKVAELNHVQHDRPDDVLFTPVNNHLFLASARRILGLSHRAFPRQQTSLLIHFGTNDHKLRTACAFNLSTGGVFIATENPLPLDTVVYIQLDLQTATEPIECQGVVTWHNAGSNPSQPDIPCGFGVQLASLKISDLFAIRTFIDEMAR